MEYSINDIIELAKEVELSDSIDWNELPLDRDKIYQIIGSQVYEMYHQSRSTENSEAILLATVTKLIIENFVLNIQVENRRDG